NVTEHVSLPVREVLAGGRASRRVERWSVGVEDATCDGRVEVPLTRRDEPRRTHDFFPGGVLQQEAGGARSKALRQDLVVAENRPNLAHGRRSGVAGSAARTVHERVARSTIRVPPTCFARSRIPGIPCPRPRSRRGSLTLPGSSFRITRDTGESNRISI